LDSFTRKRATSGAFVKRSPDRDSKVMPVNAVSSRSALRVLMPQARATAGIVSLPAAMALKMSSSTAAKRAALSQ
jgi:hypothetical protein